MSLKLIVLGPINGHLEAAFQKLAALQAKNNFSCCIATGDLFGAEGESTAELDRLLAGQVAVPVSTYFTVGTRPFPAAVAARLAAAAAERGEEADDDDAADGAELCSNLTFLGRRSVTKTADGLRIVALGGVEVEVEGDKDKTAWRPAHTRDDAAVLRGAHHADVLLTALWPRGVWRGSRVALPGSSGSSSSTADENTRQLPASDAVADLVAALRPRYHLTAAPVLQNDGDAAAAPASPLFFSYEREPFAHPPRTGHGHGHGHDHGHDDASTPDVTRFLALAPWANPAKAKALYAFALPTAGKAPTAPPPGPDQCYFCLSNPNLPTHMVCSIGTDAYLATAKGPLPEASTWKNPGPPTDGGGADGGLGFPGHMLIVPLNHAPMLTVAPAADDDAGHAAAAAATAATFREMTRFRRALQAMLAGASGDGGLGLGAVTWEISRERNVHVHWQTVPVPGALAADGLVAAAFRVEAANLGLPAMEVTEKTVPKNTSDDDDDDDEEAVLPGDAFRVWIAAPDGRETTLVLRLDPAQRFDLQLGRRVVAKLLGLEATRAVWQECAQTEAEETADVAAFRAAFAPYDFTLED